jgi:CSLREA domain-containing protein
MSHTPEDDVDRFGFTRHELLSTTSAVAPAVSLASAPQATFEVTTLADVVDANDGVLSLREAIQAANDRPGLDTITFADNLRGGTIVLEPSTLAITDDLVIDGDPLDRGAGGIVIDAGSGYWAPSPMLGLRGDPKSFMTVTVEDMSLEGSLIGGYDGSPAGIVGRYADLKMIRSSIDNMVYGAYGIAVDGFVSLTESSVSNVLDFMQAVGISSDTAISLVDSEVSGVRARGGFALDAPSIALLRSTVSDIGGTYGTSAIVGDSISIVDSTITRVSGGDVATVIRGDDVEVINSTITGNKIGSYSAARGSFGVIEGERVVVVNSTIAENRSPFPPNSYYGWVGYGIGGKDVQVSNSIVMGNGTDGLADFAPGTRVTSNGFNIFGQAAVDGARAGDVLGADARLVLATGRLADNGGPTRTLALADRAGNPALDAADPRAAPAFDQRGAPRDATPDIGAFELDNTPPAVVVTVGDPLLTRGETALVTFTFSEPVRGFGAGDVVLTARGSIGELVAGRGNIWTAVFTPADGIEQAANTIGVKARSYTDIAGNAGAGGTSPAFAIDTKAPSVAIGISDQLLTVGETATVTFTFSEAVTGFGTDDIVLTDAAGRLAGLAQASDTVWAATFTPTAGAEAVVNTIGIRPGSYTDLAGNAGAGSKSPPFAVDTLAPSVTSIAISDLTIAAGETATVTFTFSEAVKGFDIGDVDLAGAAGRLAGLAGSGAVRTAVFTPTAGVEQAVNSLAVVAGGYSDLRGNPGGGGSSARFAVDTVAPTATVAISDPLLTRGETAVVTFTFSEAVNGFTVADIDLAAAAGAIAGLAKASDTVWTATFIPAEEVEQAVNTIAVRAGSYTDIAGNPGAGAVSAAFRVDTTALVPPGTAGPTAVDDVFTVNAAAVGSKGAKLAILANDIPGDGKLDTKSVVIIDAPDDGSFTIKKGVVTYVPAPGFEGEDQLSYTVQDKAGLVSNVAEVTIAVTQPPMTRALDDSFAVEGATVGSKGAKLNILANDIPGYGKLDTKSVVITDAPDDGSFTVKKGLVTYVPAPGFEGTDTLAYTVADATGRPSDPATVSVTVTQPPLTRAVDDAFVLVAGEIGRKGARLDILVNDVPGFGKLAPKSVVVTDGPDNGSFTVKKGAVLYQPDPGFTGIDQLTYTVADATGRPSNTAKAIITVQPPAAALALADLLDDGAPEVAPPLAMAVASAAMPALDTLVATSEVV